jgi:trehalose-phosphatase
MSSPGDINGFIASVGERLDGSPLVMLLDVDGTLAPIAPTPGQAQVPESTREVLKRLVAMPDTNVALVSGRAADDAWRIVKVDGVWVIGNHGFELRDPGGTVTVDSRAAEFTEAIAAATSRLADEFRSIPGVIVENKRWTMTVHYRLANADAAPGLIARTTDIGKTHGLVATLGKEVVELRPPVRANKGTASIALIEKLDQLDGSEAEALMYAGDDSTDEDAFAALRGRYSRAVTVRVGSGGGQPARDSEAEFQLASPESLRTVLEWLLARRSRALSRS